MFLTCLVHESKECLSFYSLPADFFDKSSTKSQQQTNSLLADYGSSSEEDSDDRTSSTAKPGVAGLPTGQ